MATSRSWHSTQKQIQHVSKHSQSFYTDTKGYPPRYWYTIITCTATTSCVQFTFSQWSFHELEDRRFQVRIREGKRDMPLLVSTHTHPRSGAQSACYSMRINAIWGGGRWMDLTILLNSMWRSSTSGAVPPLPHISLMADTGTPLPLPHLFHGESIFDRSYETAWLWHANRLRRRHFVHF